MSRDRGQTRRDGAALRAIWTLKAAAQLWTAAAPKPGESEMTHRRNREPAEPRAAAAPARRAQILSAPRPAPVAASVPPPAAAPARPAWSSIFTGYRSAFGFSG